MNPFAGAAYLELHTGVEHAILPFHRLHMGHVDQIVRVDSVEARGERRSSRAESV